MQENERINMKKILLPYATMIYLLLLNYGSYGLFLGKHTKQFVFFAPLFCSIIFFAWKILKNRCINRRMTIITLVFVVCVIMSMAINNDFASDTFSMLIVLMTAFFFSQSVSYDRVKKIYVDVLVILSLYSLLATYILLPIALNGGLNFFPIYENEGRPFIDMIFTMCLKWQGVGRNNGFCREPGVFQFYILIALYYLINDKNESKNSIFKIVILLITAFTTFSPIAYIIIFITVIMLHKKYSWSLKKLFLIFFIVVVSIGLGIWVSLRNPAILHEFTRTFSKLFQGSEVGSSMSVRLSGLVGNLQVFFDAPFFGHGLVNSWRIIISRFGYEDVTGTMLGGFSAFGLIFGLLQNYLLMRLIWKNRNGWVWFIVCWISVSSQNLILSFVLWTFLYMENMNENYYIKTK